MFIECLLIAFIAIDWRFIVLVIVRGDTYTLFVPIIYLRPEHILYIIPTVYTVYIFTNNYTRLYI